MGETLAALGKPPCFTVERRQRTTFVVAWEYDGTSVHYDFETDATDYAPERKRKVRTFFSESAAYKWLARRMIFARRDEFATVPPANDKGYLRCSLCIEADRGCPPDEPGFCRYHDDESFLLLTARLARWLRWRDRKASEHG